MNNVIALRRAAAPQALDTESLATGYLFQVRWENRVNALAFCIRQLMTHHDMTEAAAELAAMQAYAAIEGVNQAARIRCQHLRWCCAPRTAMIHYRPGSPVAAGPRRRPRRRGRSRARAPRRSRALTLPFTAA